MPRGLLLLLGLAATAGAAEPPCLLPAAWRGAWFLSGRQERIIVTARRLGWLGACHSVLNTGNKFVLHRSRERCYQCVAIWPRHANVLEFKAGECQDSDSDLEALCDISPDAPLSTLVRRDGEPVDCPFRGPAAFSYNKGTGLCRSPLSELLQCMTPGQVKLRFHACPDIQQTESREESLTCVASWPDDRNASHTFLVGRLHSHYRRTMEDQIRCFLLAKTKDGFSVAQSADATCNTVLSPTDGFQTFHLERPHSPEQTHLFPEWTVDSSDDLLTFDFEQLYSFAPNRRTLVVSNYSYTTKKKKPFSRITIVNTVEVGKDWEKVVTKTVAGCDHSYRCAVLHRRTDDIMEVDFGLPTSARAAACASYFSPGATELVTLLSDQLGIHDCTLSGHHNVTSLSLDARTGPCDPQGFSSLEARCSSSNQIQFVRQCPDVAERASRATYFCQGGWEEGGEAGTSFPFPRGGESGGRGATHGFLIAKPESRDSKSLRRVCLMYAVINETYTWTVGKNSCDRSLARRPGGHRFTTALAGPCAARAAGGRGAGAGLLVLVLILEFIKR
jgi:hypothetical protein